VPRRFRESNGTAHRALEPDDRTSAWEIVDELMDAEATVGAERKRVVE